MKPPLGRNADVTHFYKVVPMAHNTEEEKAKAARYVAQAVHDEALRQQYLEMLDLGDRDAA